jgi:hypothetical protein
MKAGKSHVTVELTGEIVETFEKSGSRFAKVVLRPCHLEVVLDASTDIHLGDAVTVDATLAIARVRPALTK